MKLLGFTEACFGILTIASYAKTFDPLTMLSVTQWVTQAL
jgi:hypothetical protein